MINNIQNICYFQDALFALFGCCCCWFMPVIDQITLSCSRYCVLVYNTKTLITVEELHFRVCQSKLKSTQCLHTKFIAFFVRGHTNRAANDKHKKARIHTQTATKENELHENPYERVNVLCCELIVRWKKNHTQKKNGNNYCYWLDALPTQRELDMANKRKIMQTNYD